MRLAPDFGIVGYTDRWTYSPGEAVALHLSTDRSAQASVRLHRFRRLVPDGPGLELVAERVPGLELAVDVEPQQTRIGSWFEARLPEVSDEGRGFTLAFLAMPTAISGGGHGLCSLVRDGAGLALTLSADGTVELRCGSPEGRQPGLELPWVLRPGVWSAVAVAYDPKAGELRLSVRTDGQTTSRTGTAASSLPVSDATLLLARTAGAEDRPGFDGRLEAPLLRSTALGPEEAFRRLDAHADGLADDGGDVVAAWDFSRGMDTDQAIDVGPNGTHGRLVNLPVRAVKGSRWSGSEQSWRHAPRDYASIHFHQDDLVDAGWPVAARLPLPEDLQSGLYLIEIAGEAGCDTLPVFVRAKEPGAERLALLASTFTYLAYANDHCLLHGANPEMFANRLIVLTEADCRLAAHPEYGLSLYDTHADGSGVIHASRRRPCLTFRHTQRAWQGGLGGGLWNFGADLLILSFLEREGIAYEIVADDDLDVEGSAALAPYRCVVTGSHPEYHTARSHDALRDHLGDGGRLLYLGGNGFYWRVSTHPLHPETIELRRAEDGNRSWASEPGEYYHAFDGAYGGLWRRNGRPPQALVGVGYTGQGFFKSRAYRLSEATADPRVAFLFDEPPGAGKPLGGFGLSGGGAAGIEIDRVDPALGTPEHALVLASAFPLDDSYVLANEEVLVNRPTVTGALAPQLRADLVFFETPTGGAILATGSVAWAGSLGDPRPDNDVAQLTRRALDRFLDPLPFSAPARPERRG